MRNLFFFVFLFSLAEISIAQDTLVRKYQLQATLPVTGAKVFTDPLGNIYLITGTAFDKYDETGKLMASYSHKNGGVPVSADVSNPLRILLFYKSFQTIRVLDNTLSETIPSIPLETMGFQQISLTCLSGQDGIWIYDERSAELLKFNKSLQITHRSGNIPQQIRLSIHPVFMTEQSNLLFLADTMRGVLVFDTFGNYMKTIPLRGIQRLQVMNDEIIYYRDGLLRSYHMKTLRETVLRLPDGPCREALSEKEKLYLLHEKGIDIYYVAP